MAGRDDTVRIVVKNVYEPDDKFSVAASLDMTIAAMKALIANRVTSNGTRAAKVEEQTLVFGGRICKDEFTVGDVIRSVRCGSRV